MGKLEVRSNGRTSARERPEEDEAREGPAVREHAHAPREEDLDEACDYSLSSGLNN